MHVHAYSAPTAPAPHLFANGGLAPPAKLPADIGCVQSIAPGKTLFCEGEDAENVYEVIDGTLRLHKLLPDGRRQITGFIAAGGLVGLAQDEVYPYTAEAITHVTLRRYSRARFIRLVEQVPAVAMRLLGAAVVELAAAQDQMLLLGRKAALEKVASFLLGMARRQAAGKNAKRLHLPMTRSDIADYLGLTIETVSRSLTRLRQDGIIALPQATHVEVLNIARLERAAGARSRDDF